MDTQTPRTPTATAGSASTSVADLPAATDLSRFSLNSVTVRSARLPQLVELTAGHGFGGIGLWRDAYATKGARHAANLVQAAGLEVTSVCRGGMFTDTPTGAGTAVSEDNKKAVEEADTLNAACLVLVCGGLTPDGEDVEAPSPHSLPAARDRVRAGIESLLPLAEDAGVRLAIEPMHPMMISDRSVIASLREANDLVEEFGSENLGIALDSYHVWWDATLDDELQRSRGHLLSVQVSDWVTPIHHQLRSRGLPGQGCIDLTGFLDHTHRVGYRQRIEIEVLSDDLWAQDPALAAQQAANSLLPLANRLRCQSRETQSHEAQSQDAETHA